MKIDEQAFQKGFIQACIDNKVDALMLKNAAEAMSRDMKKQAALGGLMRLGGQALRRYAPKVLPWIAGVGAIPILRDIPRAGQRYRTALGFDEADKVIQREQAKRGLPHVQPTRQDTLSPGGVHNIKWPKWNNVMNRSIKSPFLGPNAPAMKPWQL